MGDNLDFASIEQEFKKPFKDYELGWRVLNSFKRNNKTYVNLAAYVDSRAIMKRLDSILGIDGWEDIYEEINDGFKCGIRIWITQDQSRIKWDGAPRTDFESVKGGMSNAFKRAANKWGIGRYLYDENLVSTELLPQRGNNGEYNYFQDKKKDLKGYYKVPVKSQKAKAPIEPPARDESDQELEKIFEGLNDYEYKLGLSNKPKLSVRIFNRANNITENLNVNQIDYIHNKASKAELKKYYLALRPLYNICMAANKFETSLDEVLKYAQIIKPEIEVTNVFSLLFQLTNDEVKQIFEIAETEYNNNKEQAM
ncbi:Rad52/Rad22 family DNA repair protein [Terribacillus saccharophilus]|uniref:Rad52/Rad22 family DNA repair protein n=1 Tax=Terribacillus saccharophilus TaxID=361277 RepID=UPI003D29F2C6